MASFKLNVAGKNAIVWTRNNQNQVISRIEQSTAHIYFHLKIAHAFIGPDLNRIERTDDDASGWCLPGMVQTPERSFNNCMRWYYQNQKANLHGVTSGLGRSMTNTSITDLLWHRRCSEVGVPYLRATEIDADVVSGAGKLRRCQTLPCTD
jgi:hypothetical protein